MEGNFPCCSQSCQCQLLSGFSPAPLLGRASERREGHDRLTCSPRRLAQKCPSELMRDLQRPCENKYVSSSVFSSLCLARWQVMTLTGLVYFLSFSLMSHFYILAQKPWPKACSGMRVVSLCRVHAEKETATCVREMRMAHRRDRVKERAKKSCFSLQLATMKRKPHTNNRLSIICCTW